jgi:hypothetical protein
VVLTPVKPVGLANVRGEVFNIGLRACICREGVILRNVLNRTRINVVLLVAQQLRGVQGDFRGRNGDD